MKAPLRGSAEFSTPINPATHQENAWEWQWFMVESCSALISGLHWQCQGEIVNWSVIMWQRGQKRRAANSVFYTLITPVGSRLSISSRPILSVSSFIHISLQISCFLFSFLHPFLRHPFLLLSPSQPSGCAPHGCHGNDIVSHLCNVMSY